MEASNNNSMQRVCLMCKTSKVNMDEMYPQCCSIVHIFAHISNIPLLFKLMLEVCGLGSTVFVLACIACVAFSTEDEFTF